MRARGERDDGRSGRSEPPPAPVAGEGDADLDVDRPIRCAACDAPITSTRHRVEVHGAHAHRRVNPSGHDFHLGCFAAAPGCRVEGPPTLFWTWFPGYAWRLASCADCGTHLGWAFEGDGASFFGLILPRLRMPE